MEHTVNLGQLAEQCGGCGATYSEACEEWCDVRKGWYVNS